MPGLGRSQRAALDVMHRHGGVWPPHWRTTYAQRAILESLRRLGILVHLDGVYRIAAFS